MSPDRAFKYGFSSNFQNRDFLYLFAKTRYLLNYDRQSGPFSCRTLHIVKNFITLSERIKTKLKLSYIDKGAAGGCAGFGKSYAISLFFPSAATRYELHMKSSLKPLCEITHGVTRPPICHDLSRLTRPPPPPFP